MKKRFIMLTQWPHDINGSGSQGYTLAPYLMNFVIKASCPFWEVGVGYVKETSDIQLSDLFNLED